MDSATVVRGSAAQAMVWRFGNAELDESQMELRVAGSVAVLERKPLEVLRHLLRHAGEVVTKEELLEAVWPGRVLSETVLTKAVGRIRDELDERAGASVKTVHGYGYRLLAEVSVVAPKPAPRPAPELALKLGDRLPDRPNWLLDQHLDSGGHGEVWRVRHEKTGENRVLKFALDGDRLTSLKREVTLHRLFAAQLAGKSPMLPVLDFNLDEAPFFIELPYIAGGNLAHFFETSLAGASFTRSQRLALFIRIAQLVAQAHAVGVLHKDLKPANVLIDLRGNEAQALLADFGSAGVMSDEILAGAGITGVGFTQREERVGTTALYVAPEVLRGQPFTTQSDLYALGVMLYQLVVLDFSRPLATGWEADIDDELLREDIAAATQGSPERRLNSVAELVQRLIGLDARREREQVQNEQSRRALLAEQRAAKAIQQAEQLRIRRGWMAAVTGVFLLGATLASVFAFRARAAAEQAKAANASTQSTMQFLVSDVLGAVSLSYGPAKLLTLNQVIERAAKKIDQRFSPTDLASRAQTYRALYEVYGVTDYTTINREFEDWLYRQKINAVTAWFESDADDAYPLAFQTVSSADFWDDDPALQALLDQTASYAEGNGRLPVNDKLSLSLSKVEAQIKRSEWRSAQTTLATLNTGLLKEFESLLNSEPHVLVSSINDSTRLGLHAQASAFCVKLLEQINAPRFASSHGLRLDALEACAVAAAYRGDSGQTVSLAKQGLLLARDNYDELVGYVATFTRFLALGLAGEGRIAEALAAADQSVELREQRRDGLLPYVQAGRGVLLEAADKPDRALTDYQLASEALTDTAMPLLAIEAHTRLSRALARAGRMADARRAFERLTPSVIAQLPDDHRSRASIMQAEAWLVVDTLEAQNKITAADTLLAKVGLPVDHFARLELASDREQLTSRVLASRPSH